MIIDGRKTDIHDVLKGIKDAYDCKHNEEISIDVLLANAHDAKKVKAFCKMSGCSINVQHLEGDDVKLIVTGGSSCLCG